MKQWASKGYRAHWRGTRDTETSTVTTRIYLLGSGINKPRVQVLLLPDSYTHRFTQETTLYSVMRRNCLQFRRKWCRDLCKHVCLLSSSKSACICKNDDAYFHCQSLQSIQRTTFLYRWSRGVVADSEFRCLSWRCHFPIKTSTETTILSTIIYTYFFKS